MGTASSSNTASLAAKARRATGPWPSNAQCATDAQCASNECCVHNLCTSAPELCPKNASASVVKYPCSSFTGVTDRTACQVRCGNDAQCDFACRTCNGENVDVPAGWAWLSHTRSSVPDMTPAQYYASWASTITVPPYNAPHAPKGAPDALF